MKTLIKSVEFVVVVGISLLGFLFGAIPLLWFLAIAGGYILVNLMGWANRSIGGGGVSDPTGRRDSIPGGGVSEPTKKG